MKKIYLAGGCFRGIEAYFKKIGGVLETEVGYANGKTASTNYQIVSQTDHAETVEISYDEKILPLEKLLEYYYYVIDPTSINKQGNDIGRQYRTGIYCKNKEDLEKAKKFLEEKQKQENLKIRVEVKMLENFIKAEDYHQDYLTKNPTGYCHVDLNDIPMF